MSNNTRTNGANARAQGWDDFEEAPGYQRKATWLPLEILDEQAYGASPQLRAMPISPAAPKRNIFGPRPTKPASTAPTRNEPTRKQARKTSQRVASGRLGTQTRSVGIILGTAFSLLAAYVAVLDQVASDPEPTKH